MKSTIALLAVLCSLGFAPAQEDQPHSRSQNFSCTSCHSSHEVFGNMIGSVEGSANLCLSCHQAGGMASAKPLADHQQASLYPQASAQPPSSGTSHRWDASISGRIQALGAAPQNALQTGGQYSGSYPASYTITIASEGNAGTATFNWSTTAPGSQGGSAILTGTNIPIEQGLTLSFLDPGPAASFKPGDSWQVFVRPDLNPPSNPELSSRMPSGKVVCSTCHDAHSQSQEPFDPTAPAYEPGAGAGRHYMRMQNDADQLCAQCHAARFVASSAAGSHPVGILISTNSFLHAPITLPLDKAQGRMQCQTCHALHNSPAKDGILLRTATERQLCLECHALADSTTPAAHLNVVKGPLWPGGQYGSQKPVDQQVTNRGACSTCHQVHGQPDALNATNHYPTLLVEKEENLCYTCHDGSPETKNIRALFSSTYSHPVTLSGRHKTDESTPASYGTANRHSECADCHNVHQLTRDPVEPKAPSASAAMKGVPRVSVNNLSATSLTYTFKPASDPSPIKEYEVCFVCHSSWTTLPTTRTNMAAKFNDKNLSYHPVEAIGKNLNINPITFTNGWTETSLTYCTDCHTSDNTAVRGPHASANQWILKKPYTTAITPALPSNYLCFDCHSYAVYGANVAGSRFRNVDRSGHNHGGYSCYACHESHGSSTKPFLLGNRITTYTKSTTGGTCDPSCHGSESYTVAYPR